MVGAKESNMLDSALHVGIEHPNLFWIAVPTLLAFGVGLGLGLYSQRKDDESDMQTEPVPESET